MDSLRIGRLRCDKTSPWALDGVVLRRRRDAKMQRRYRRTKQSHTVFVFVRR